MNIAFHHWHRYCKIALFMGVCMLVISVDAFVWIRPVWKNLRSLRKENATLNAQWQQQHAAIEKHQQLLHDLTSLRHPYLPRLQVLHQTTSPASIYMQITRLLKTQRLQIIAIKPQQQQIGAGLIRQIFDIDIKGPETSVFNFLHLLMHQPWLLEVQRLDLTTLDQGVHLQATFTIHYVGK